MMIAFSIIFKYAFYLFAFIGIINICIMKLRLNSAIKREEITNNEAAKLLKGASFVLIFPFIILGLIQSLGGFDNVFFLFSRELNVFIILSWIIVFFSWIASLYWVIFKNGTKVLIKYRKVLGINIPTNEKILILYLLLMVLGGVLALIFGVKNDVGNMIKFTNHIR